MEVTTLWLQARAPCQRLCLSLVVSPHRMNRTRMAVASGIGSCLLTVALFVSNHLDMQRHGVAVTPSFHFGLFDGGAWFYSDERPYHGSIVQIDGQPPISQKSSLDFPGVYYRYFRFPAHTTWSLMVSLWYPIVLFAIPPALWIFHRRRLHLTHEDKG